MCEKRWGEVFSKLGMDQDFRVVTMSDISMCIEDAWFCVKEIDIGMASQCNCELVWSVQ